MRLKLLSLLPIFAFAANSVTATVLAAESPKERTSNGQNNFLRAVGEIGPFARQFCSDGEPGCEDAQGIGFVEIEGTYGYFEDVTLLFVCPDTHPGRCIVLPRRFGEVDYPIPATSELLEKLKSAPTGGDFRSPSQGEQKLIITRLLKSFDLKKNGMKLDGCEPVRAHEMACYVSSSTGGNAHGVLWSQFMDWSGLK